MTTPTENELLRRGVLDLLRNDHRMTLADKRRALKVTIKAANGARLEFDDYPGPIPRHGESVDMTVEGVQVLGRVINVTHGFTKHGIEVRVLLR